MICTSTSGITINSSERTNIVCGSKRLIRLRWRMSRSAGASPGVSPLNGLTLNLTDASQSEIAALDAYGVTVTPEPGSLSLLWFNPSTHRDRFLIKTPGTPAGVLAAVPFGQPVSR